MFVDDLSGEIGPDIPQDEAKAWMFTTSLAIQMVMRELLTLEPSTRNRGVIYGAGEAVGMILGLIGDTENRAEVAALFTYGMEQALQFQTTLHSTAGRA